MKNLKRVLSLVLATVMVIGMMVVGASAADYKDADKIDYTEAVDVMSAVGMIEGWDGSFGPDLTIDRAGAAKLIAYLNLGKDLADKLTVTENPFNDVDKNAWYAGYVAYCKSEKLIEGWNGNFDPAGTMTAYGFAKLLLGALGYDAAAEGMTGDSWEVNTAKLAISTKLFDGNTTASGNDPMTRQEACLYAFNALKATMVEYKGGSDITIGDIVISNNKERVDVENKVDDYVAATADGKMQLCEYLYHDAAGKATLKLENNKTDSFGRTANVWTFSDDTIGTYANGSATKTVVVTKDQKLSALLKGINSKYDVNTDNAFLNGTSEKKDHDVKIGDIVEIYVEGGKVAKTVTMTTTLEKITRVTKATGTDADYTYMVTVAGVNYKDTALTGFNADTMEKGDYVLYTPGSKVAILAEADVVTGKMTAKGTGYVKVDGEKYTYSGHSDVLDNYTNTYDFYLDANGYVVGYIEVEKAKEDVNVFYVKGSKLEAGDEFSGETAMISVTYLDGTSAILDLVVDKDGNINVNGKDVKLPTGKEEKPTIVPGPFAYTTDSNGDVKTLQRVDNAGAVKDWYQTTTSGTGVSINKADAKIVYTYYGGGRKTFYATSETILTTIKDGSAKTVTGYKNFDAKTYNVDKDISTVIVNTDGDTVLAIYVLGGTMTEVEELVYGWLVDTGDIYKENSTEYQDVIYNVDGENEPFKVEKAEGYPEFATIVVTDGVAKLTKIDKDEDDTHYVDKTVEKVTDSYIVVNGDVIDFADGVAFYDVTNVADNGVVPADGVDATSTVTYVLNSDKKIAALYITYGAQEDGVLASNDVTYIEKVLGVTDKGDLAELAKDGNDWIVFQYTRPAKTTKNTLTVYNDKDEVVYHEYNANDTAGTRCFMLDPNGHNVGDKTVDNTNSGIDLKLSGTYTYTVACNGEVVVAGSFEV